MSGGRDQQRANTQQLQILREENKTTTLPRHNCFDELKQLFKEKFAKEGHEVIMGIDANESMAGNKPRSLRRLMSDLGLHDAIVYANPGQTQGKTMKTGGTEKNDHIQITTGAFKLIRSAEELQYDTTYIADHPSLFLNIDGAMLSRDFTHFCNSGNRNIRSNDKKECRKHVTILEKLCKQNAIFAWMDKLSKVHLTQWTPNHNKRLNNTDAHLTRLMLRAEKNAKSETVKATRQAKNFTSPPADCPTGTTSKSCSYPPKT
jgi:hypothetical protein